MKVPGPDHPITITPNPRKVRVEVDGQLLAETTHALSLQEATYGAVLYIPRNDVKLGLLERTEHSTHCPYKGDASYYTIKDGKDGKAGTGGSKVNAIWSYEKPFPAMKQITGYMAFYPDKVTLTES